MTESLDSRKLFAGGLSGNTSEKDITDYFSKYGEVESVDLKKDHVTQRSRGFGFVTFKTPAALDAAVAEKFHTINGKKFEPRKAKVQTSKIFVGGLKDELSDEDIKTHFSQFGNITDAQIPFDKQNNKRKGFCFLIFEGADTAKKIIEQDGGKQTINGVQVDVKKAIPTEQQGGGRGGRGGGRGGFRGGAQNGGGWGGGYDQYGGYGGGYDQYAGYGGGYDYSGYGDGYDYSGYGGGYDYSGYGGYGANGYAAQGNGQSFGGGKVPAARGRGRGGPRGQPY